MVFGTEVEGFLITLVVIQPARGGQRGISSGGFCEDAFDDGRATLWIGGVLHRGGGQFIADGALGIGGGDFLGQIREGGTEEIGSERGEQFAPSRVEEESAEELGRFDA